MNKSKFSKHRAKSAGILPLPRRSVGSLQGTRREIGYWRPIFKPSSKPSHSFIIRQRKRIPANEDPSVALNVLQLNVCGLRNKVLEVTKLLLEQNVDVALIQEARLGT